MVLTKRLGELDPLMKRKQDQYVLNFVANPVNKHARCRRIC
jgi:hypothetical protein